jgi:hypothetical protein
MIFGEGAPALGAGETSFIRHYSRTAEPSDARPMLLASATGRGNHSALTAP